jgi:succinate dehydrogenase / fumarate reductase flavoprotein subunit
LLRDESCGCHLREEHQTPEGEAKRNDEEFAFTSVFEYMGEDKEPALNKEPLKFEALPLMTRNYKS